MKTIEEIREAFHKIHDVAIGKSDRAYMSIPADRERDADLIVSDAISELERLRNATPGDTESQAAAWTAVWKELETLGLLSFVAAPVMSCGRDRAIQFIRHLAAQAAVAAAYR